MEQTDQIHEALSKAGLPTTVTPELVGLDKTSKKRLDYLELAIETYRPDICIVDGIADLLNDINSGPDSVELMQQMVQKPYEVFNCDRVEKGQAFTVTHTVSRRFNTKNELCYAIGDNGLPVMSEAQADNTRKDGNGRQPDSTTFNKEFVDNDAADQHLPWLFRKLFTAAFGSAAMLGSNDLEQRVMDLANIKQKQYYYKVLDEAERQRIVRKELTRTGRVGVILVPPS